MKRGAVSGILDRLIDGVDLTMEEAGGLMGDVMSGGLEEAQIAALLVALRSKGETADEIAGFAAAMRKHSIRIRPRREGLIDTCGTGGDGRHTFNISTAAALIAAAIGIPVAKHGNRAVSSRCGSADVLEKLGVNLDLEPDAVARVIDRVGIGFLFAPGLHPAMKHAAPVRKKLGVRTVFNILGPLTNPAGVKRQILGVFRPDLTVTLCRVLDRLGSERAYVVHGVDGSDEISITCETIVSTLEGGEVRTFRFSPEDAGLKRAGPGSIDGGSPDENAAILLEIFRGAEGPRTDAALLNAGFAALLADRAEDVVDGVLLAREAIRSGRALEILEGLVDATRTEGRTGE